MTLKENWEGWNDERKHFQERDTEGFTKDLTALEAHIKKLTEVCPKDKAGWPVTTALLYIDRLTSAYNRFKRYLNLCS